MAAPSEQITWKRLGIPASGRRCSMCNQPLVLPAGGPQGNVSSQELRQYHVTVQPRSVRLSCRGCGPVLA